MTISKKNFVLGGLAIFVMFLPRRLELMGMYSFRLVIVSFLILGFFIMQKQIRISGIFKRPGYILYILMLCGQYICHGEIVSLIGYLADICFLYLLLNSFIENKIDLDFYVKVFLKILVIYCIQCIFETLTGINIWSFFGVGISEYQRYGFYRCYGAFTTPINNGVFLFLTFPLIWYAKEYCKEKKLVKICNFFVWIALICTLSRAPILGALLIHILIVWRTGIVVFIKKNFLKIIVIAFFGTLAIATIPSISRATTAFVNMFLAIINPEIANSIADSFGKNAVGIGQRNNLYAWVWETVKNQKWFGMGPNAKFAYDWEVNSGYIATKTSIENFYLATLYRFGIVGLISLIIFFFGEIISILRKINRSNKLQLNKEKTTFEFKIFFTIIIYFIVLTTVSAMDDYKMLFILILLSDKLYSGIELYESK